MAEKRIQRRLAAILAADVVGYSRLMEESEAETLAALKSRWRSVMAPEVAQHNGRVVKLMGDGVLVEFGSAVDAVQCAVALQKGFASANEAVPQDRQIILRIGINLGDVIVEGADLYGDGVNIAARLEALAEPGSIFVSASVYDQVKRKLSAGFDDLGPQVVKNIVELIHVYRVSEGPAKQPPNRPKLRRKALSGKVVLAVAAGLGLAVMAFVLWPRVADRTGPPVIAVLAFTNLSGDPGQDYLGPGIAVDIITMLSTSPLVRVVSKSSSFQFRDAREITLVARELDVDYIVEGSIRRVGNTMRISTQLVQGASGQNLWSERFEQQGTDITLLQEAVARKVYATLAGTKGEIANFEKNLSWGKAGPGLEEYDFHLRGGTEFLKWDNDSKALARQIWLDGLERFPESVLLRLELAAFYNNAAVEGPSIDPWQDIQTAWRLIGETDAFPAKSRIEEWLYHYIKAMVYPVVQGDFKAAVREAEAAHALVPYDPLSSIDLSFVLANAGRAEMAVEWAEYAVANEAIVPDWYRDRLAWAYYNAGRAEEAVEQYERISYFCGICKAAALVRAGRIDEAKTLISAAKTENSGVTLALAGLAPGDRFPLMAEVVLAPYLADLKAAGLE